MHFCRFPRHGRQPFCTAPTWVLVARVVFATQGATTTRLAPAGTRRPRPRRYWRHDGPPAGAGRDARPKGRRLPGHHQMTADGRDGTEAGRLRRGAPCRPCRDTQVATATRPAPAGSRRPQPRRSWVWDCPQAAASHPVAARRWRGPPAHHLEGADAHDGRAARGDTARGQMPAAPPHPGASVPAQLIRPQQASKPASTSVRAAPPHA